MKQNKLLALESLRGIAAISVAFFHFNIGSHFNNDFVRNAWLMVDFFFVLSGFVIALNYMDRIKTINDLSRFQIKRFLRLYPLHFLMLFTFLGIEFAKYIAENQFGMVANNRAFSINDLTAFIANLFLIQNWSLSDLTYNYPSWSISAEFFTYAIFAILILVSKANKIFLVTALTIGILTFGFSLNEIGMGTGNLTGGPLRCLYSFSIGALIFIIYSKVRSMNMSLTSMLPLLLIAVSIYIVSQYGTKKFEYVVLIPILFGITILSIALDNTESLLNKTLSRKWLVYLGTISYGIYMIHACVWWMITQTMRFVFKVPNTTDSDGKIKIVIENIFIADLISIFGISVVILLAHFSFKFYESKFTYR